MSHFTSVRTKIQDKECLLKTLKEMKYEYIESKIPVAGYSPKIYADISVQTVDMPQNIGFVWNGKTYDVLSSGDGYKVKKFANQVTQKYAYNKTIHSLTKQGLVIGEETINARGEIVLTVRQW